MSTIDELMERNYRISLRWDNEEDLYFASVDDLPGCLADGRSANKAVENLREAMRVWMSSRLAAGLEVPEPKEASDYSGKILVRMPKSLHEKLAIQADSEGVSLNQHIVAALSEVCGRAQAEARYATSFLKTYGSNLSEYIGKVRKSWGSYSLGVSSTNVPPFLNLIQGSMFIGSVDELTAQQIGTVDIATELAEPTSTTAREAPPAA